MFRRGSKMRCCRLRGMRRCYFSMISKVGLPQDVTAREFRVECIFPVEGTVPADADSLRE
jgi:hypothetical protein